MKWPYGMIKHLLVNCRNALAHCYKQFCACLLQKIIGSRMTAGLKHTSSLAFHKAHIIAVTQTTIVKPSQSQTQSVTKQVNTVLVSKVSRCSFIDHYMLN
jgi:hypothetical protein